MLEVASPSQSTALHYQKLVVLVLPELLEGLPDLAALRRTFGGPIRRILVCFAEHGDPALVARLAECNVEAQFLIGPAVERPDTKGVVLKAPDGTLPIELIEFALALSDVILASAQIQKAPPTNQLAKLIEQITLLKKPMCEPGAELPLDAPVVSVTAVLDPVTPGLLKSVGIRGKWSPYFAPTDWVDRAPDRAARGSAAPIVASFDAFDRTALFGARRHRRLTWLTHFCAAFAVLFAIMAQTNFGFETGAGDLCEGDPGEAMNCPLTPNTTRPPEIAPSTSAPEPAGKSSDAATNDPQDHAQTPTLPAHDSKVPLPDRGATTFTVKPPTWVEDVHHAFSALELVALLTVGGIYFYLRRSSLQERWMACRLGAEQLRIARMTLPALVLPPALATSEEIATGDTSLSTETQFSFRALAEVKRIVREQGLPQLGANVSIDDITRWLHLIVDDQMTYHKANAHRLKRVKERLEVATISVFLIALGAVGTHLTLSFFHTPSGPEGLWLIATAAGPALAAALHGAGTRLGIVHRAALSNDAANELKSVAKELADCCDGKTSIDIGWAKLRLLAETAADVMGRENTSWHGLVSRYTDDLPA